MVGEWCGFVGFCTLHRLHRGFTPYLYIHNSMRLFTRQQKVPGMWACTKKGLMLLQFISRSSSYRGSASISPAAARAMGSTSPWGGVLDAVIVCCESPAFDG